MDHIIHVFDLLTRALVMIVVGVFFCPLQSFPIYLTPMRRSSRNFQYPFVHQLYTCQKEKNLICDVISDHISNHMDNVPSMIS